MAILLMNNKGFLLIDALINVFIVILLSIIGIAIFNQFGNYYKAYEKYNNEANLDYDFLFNNIKECEDCQIEDLSKQDS